MSIIVIEGPEDPDTRPRVASDVLHAVQASLAQRALAAGQSFIHHRCRSEADLIHRLHHARHDGADIVLLDPNACTRPGTALLDALRGLDVPYIEVHDDRSDAPEQVLPPRCGPLVAVVNGYAAQSYTLALSVALEKLGCAECECDVHVGT